MSLKPVDIVMMAGGTGGHVFPALAIAQAARQQGYSISWLGTAEKIEAKVVPQAGFEIDFLPIQSLRGKGIFTYCLLPFRLLRAVLQARAILEQRKPKLVIGLGGFATGPGGIASWNLKIPLVIHEQNTIAGLTNRVLAKLATQIYCAFDTAFAKKVAAQTIGNPLRKDFLMAAQSPAPSHNPKGPLHILVIGGSLGASALNKTVPEALAKLPAEKFEIWHQSGEKTFADTEHSYKNAGISAKITPFIEDMVKAYHWSDVVICRAGALTISELTALGKPAILIPLPTAADNHQYYNAQYLARHQAGICLVQKEFTAEKLADLLTPWLTDRRPLLTMAKQAKALAQLDAAKQLLKGCLPFLTE